MSRGIFTGIDIGGTNTDVAVVGDDITTTKVANTEGLARALSLINKKIPLKKRLAISTSQPLNRILTDTNISVQTITIPGAGLAYPDAVSGMVNHAGDILEDIDPDEARRNIADNKADCLCIAGKFSVRNPEQEERIREIALDYYPADRIAVSHYIGRTDYPARIATTELNARIMDAVTNMTGMIRHHNPDFYYFKGDGGLARPEQILNNPSLLYNSSPAAVALGAYYLAGEKNCLVVDIGGTTTDLVELKNGIPTVREKTIEGKRTHIRSIASSSIPYGGDSVIEDSLLPRREGNACAFGGNRPTLTDALNRAGHSIGDKNRFSSLDRELAEMVLDHYVKTISTAIRAKQPKKLVGTGYLAPYLITAIADNTGIPANIPEFAACANAVGVAVSRVSLDLHVHADTGRGTIVMNGKVTRPGRTWTDDDLIAICTDELKEQALSLGAPPDDLLDIELACFSAYDAVRAGRTAERIADLVLKIPPGITVEAA